MNKSPWIETIPKAACVLITNEDGKVLCVSRKNDPSALGLPGGKQDPHEFLDKTAARETLEETGILVEIPGQIPYIGMDGEFQVTTFEANIEMEYKNPTASEETGEVSWRDPMELIESSPFAEYNKEMLVHFCVLKKFQVYYWQVKHYDSSKLIEVPDIEYAKTSTDAIKQFIRRHKGKFDVKKVVDIS